MKTIATWAQMKHRKSNDPARQKKEKKRRTPWELE